MPVVSLQEKKQQLVRDAIWDAAIRLFIDQGFHETTVDDIADAAGVSRRSFFRYYSSKNDLLAQGILTYADNLANQIRDCPPAWSAPQVFRHVVAQTAQQQADDPRTRLIMQITVKHPAAREAQVSRVHEAQGRIADAYVKRMSGSGKSELKANLLASMTLSILGVIFRVWAENGARDMAGTVRRAFSTLEELAADPASSDE